MFEYIIALNGILADIKRTGMTVAGAKFQFYMASFWIVGYIYDING